MNEQLSPLGYGEIHRFILEALSERPRHGYELMDRIGVRVGAGYRPSAGTIYPRLRKLAQERLIAPARVGRIIVYTLTEEGRSEVERHQASNQGPVHLTVNSDGAVLEEALGFVETFCRNIADELSKSAHVCALDGTVIRDIELQLTKAHEEIKCLLGPG